MRREFVNDEATKELLSAVEAYARARGLERVMLTYLGEHRGKAVTWEEAAGGDDVVGLARDFRLEASHWYEVMP